MSLHIKDPETHKLAQALAKETGETMTHAVTEALRERLDRVRRRRNRKLRSTSSSPSGADALVPSNASQSFTAPCSTMSGAFHDDCRQLGLTRHLV